jgi:hypothetical protein
MLANIGMISIGKGIEMEVPAFTTLTDEVREHIIRVGWRNVLMDSHASMTAEKANGGDVQALSRDMAQRKLEALMRGEIRTSTAREVDPVKAEALRLATVASRNKGKNEKEAKVAAREFLATPSPALDKLLVKAKRNVKEIGDIDLD